ncbi:MAG TPA: hypothetical protein PLL10_07550 [Elusimicrobiales bacterium]|nr:hypothetical protein [Elusimicrobiales bacterium]
MKTDNDDEIFGKLKAQKPEAFWNRQRARIMQALPERRRALVAVPAWSLAPALAALVLGAAWLLNHPNRVKLQPTPAVSEQMLENLDMLSELELLQRIPERELI